MPNPSTVEIVRRRLADGRTIADSDVRRLVAEIDRLRALLANYPTKPSQEPQDGGEVGGLDSPCGCGQGTIADCVVMPSRHCGAWRDDADV